MQITIALPVPASISRHWKWLLLAIFALALVLLSPPARVAASGLSIATPDTAGNVGQWTSLTLDASGRPVVSYRDVTNSRIKLLHCGDANCTSGNVMGPVDTASVGFGTSVAIDSAGNAAVSYVGDITASPYLTLKVMRCKDPYCVGLDAYVAAPDASLPDGFHSSIVLDSIGRPVISSGGGFGGLILTYCGSTDCSFANSNTNANPTGIQWTSIVLDALGKPVVSYANGTLGELGLLHCGNPNCNSGNSIVDPDTGSVGQYTSVKLDGSGFPVISYYDYGNGDLKILHCGNPNCTAGNNIALVDAVGDVGQYTSLALDSLGRPVVSYYDATNADLKIVRCGDANCATFLKVSPDTAGDVGKHTSLKLDAAGNPVVSYYDATNGDLKVLHCGDANCLGSKPPPKLNITDEAAYYPPKSCYQVYNSTNTTLLFNVCDNDWVGPPNTNAVCLHSGNLCTDEDPSQGKISVTLAAGDYHVVQAIAPPNHNLEVFKHDCNVPVGSASCAITSINMPQVRPWHPWDITNDGPVTVADILAVVGKFAQNKSCTLDGGGHCIIPGPTPMAP